MYSRDPRKLPRKSNVRVRLRNDAGERRGGIEEPADNEVVISDSVVGSDGRENTFARSCHQVIIL